MINIILSGCCGNMGHNLTAAVSEHEDIKIIYGVDISEAADLPYPVFDSFDQLPSCDGVIVDFSHPSMLNGLLSYALNNRIPAVVCSTGYDESQLNQIHMASEQIPVFFSANMSLGINLLSALAKYAAKVLGDDFDIEIVEAHHNRKLDAPSGTAVMLKNSVAEGLKYEPELVFDRHSRRRKRDKHEIGMHSIRGGTIVGEHEIIFAGPEETIRLSHSAQSRSVFARGAINAAKFLSGRSAGLYDMGDLINQ